MHFYLLAEGKTERDCLRTWLADWLNARLGQKVGIKAIKHSGWRHLWDDAPERARSLIQGPGASDVIGVVAMLDLYGPTIFPASCTTTDQKIAWARQQMDGRFRHAQFLLCFAVHETEAWLLSDPSIFPRELRPRIEDVTARPEAVNAQEPPAKLLDRLYETTLKRGYKKTVDGKNLFSQLSVEVAVPKCPHLSAMLEAMRQMAVARGIPSVGN